MLIGLNQDSGWHPFWSFAYSGCRWWRLVEHSKAGLRMEEMVFDGWLTMIKFDLGFFGGNGAW